ncbi:hypothetical protein MWU59_10535 [Flavobacteriaceae bacterium F08102]|nr:hypothetical protein [Flavobacteriaceae bacterium F08102]
MRWIFMCLLGFISCKSQQNTLLPSPPVSTIISPVMQDGTTHAELIPNAQLQIQSGQFNHRSIEIIPGKMIVFKFQYQQNQHPDSVDGQYEELLFFEISDLSKKIMLKDDQLHNVKMTYARLCYCKGTSGYFAVSKGLLSIQPQGDMLRIKATFQIDSIPQRIHTINLILPQK